MTDFILFRNEQVAPILLEDNGVLGVEKMTGIFAKDIEMVTGATPDILKDIPQEDYIIYVGLTESPLVTDRLADKINLDEIKGKREVYGVYILQDVFHKLCG